MLLKKSPLALAVVGLALSTPLTAVADESETDVVELDTYTVTAVRENRISTGATGLPLEIKDTPQSISVIGAEEMLEYGATGSNDALDLMNGIDIQEWETNRSTLNAPKPGHQEQHDHGQHAPIGDAQLLEVEIAGQNHQNGHCSGRHRQGRKLHHGVSTARWIRAPAACRPRWHSAAGGHRPPPRRARGQRAPHPGAWR